MHLVQASLYEGAHLRLSVLVVFCGKNRLMYGFFLIKIILIMKILDLLFKTNTVITLTVCRGGIY